MASKSKYGWRLLTKVDFNAKDKGLLEAVRKGLRVAAQWWADNCRKRHFEQSARARYKYQPRTTGTRKKKLRALQRGYVQVRLYQRTRLGQVSPAAMYGPGVRIVVNRRGAMARIPVDHNVMYDMTWTGRTKREFINNPARIEQTRTTVKVRVKVPPYVNARRGAGPNKRAELTALADDERQYMAGIVRSAVTTFLAHREPDYKPLIAAG